eukprot:04347.XXX_183179_183322_1 [CDS] Oithona nana genome sequencing.
MNETHCVVILNIYVNEIKFKSIKNTRRLEFQNEVLKMSNPLMFWISL